MFPGSLIKLQEDKFKDMQANIETVHNARGTPQLMLVRTIAGQVSWASGISEWLKCFNACVWAALSSHSAELAAARCLVCRKAMRKRLLTDIFFTIRTKQAFAWIRLLLAGLVKDPKGKAFIPGKWQSLHLQHREYTCTVRTDASP
jgi:hypothetical protein